MIRIFLAFLILAWSLPTTAQTIPQNLQQCTALCKQYFPGEPVVPPVDPPVTPPAGVKPYPGNLTFDKTCDQGPPSVFIGGACVLAGTDWEGKILEVTLNGEKAVQGNSYKGRPTFYFSKSGDKYAMPLTFLFKTTIGNYSYIATAAPEPVVGTNSETARPSSCGNPDGPGCRNNYRFTHPGSYYGKTPVVTCGGKTWRVRDSSKRQEESNGWIWKPLSDSKPSRLVVVGEYKARWPECAVKW
ncbi:MAG TPA: hypothetical protein DCR39_05930 [Nitrospiraceae bacterium]|nr:hypothetical protein [Nitrospiraceae bacterium]